MAFESSPGHFKGSFSALGEPHFTGFDGKHFDFQGEPNRFYNLITFPNFQLNALFSDWLTTPNTTAMRQVGIAMRSGTEVLRIKLNEDGGFSFNNNVISPPIKIGIVSFDRLDQAPEVYQKMGEVVNRIGMTTILHGYSIDYGVLNLFISYESDGVNAPYYNVVGTLDSDLLPHGIIGQTSNPNRVVNHNIPGDQGGGIIEGSYGDYEVNSLFGNNFKFNLFGL